MQIATVIYSSAGQWLFAVLITPQLYATTIANINQRCFIFSVKTQSIKIKSRAVQQVAHTATESPN
jgi:hypothetical protein